MQKLKLAVLISGSGSNLQAIIDACADEDFPARVMCVISNRPDAHGLKRARDAGISAHIVDHKVYDSRADFEEVLDDTLNHYDLDLICLAGFMRILGAGFIGKWENQILNTHPSLLPKFGGEGMYGEHVHRAVLDAGESESGATIHFVIPDVDKGPIVLQRSVPVLEGDSIETLSARVIEQEHIAYPEAIAKIARERLEKP